ncbi:MAG TPA: FkbM family methyltransferase [Saprospiraceae bacterium]|nr:FkbM family methyltransferase [Saprospiraceae bacterium]
MPLSTKFRKRIGLIKSIAIYYWKPFNQRRLRKFYSQFISPGDLCFDIGAHVGNRTQAWLSLGARVIAVEPQPECIKYLKRRFAANHEVTIVDQAAGSRSGEAILYVSSANPTVSTLSDEAWRKQMNHDARYPIFWDRQVQVKMTTLDDLIARYGIPSFCKIDVENAEYEVLLGLSQALPQLSFEYYPPVMENTFRCLERLESLGSYEFNWSFGESLRLYSAQWVNAEAIGRVLRGYTTRYQYGDIYARRRHD